MRGIVSGRAEDYLRAVYEIVQQKGCARTNDISKELNVQQPTVVEMMKKLHNRGFVIYEKYGGISLTPEGKDIVKVVKKRHDTFQKFLKLISVPEDIASKDADVLEHLLHPETILQFKRFVDFIDHASATGHPRFVERWIEQFKEYCEKEK
jgi:DtxR family transcriptional regulator, manganese transport regulator